MYNMSLLMEDDHRNVHSNAQNSQPGKGKVFNQLFISEGPFTKIKKM